MQIRTRTVSFAAGLGVALVAAPALAADVAGQADVPTFIEPATTGFDVTIGAGPDVQNKFPGAKEIFVLPSIHLGYRKVGEPDPFYTPDDAFDVSVFDNPYLRVGPAANFIGSRGQGGGFFGLHGIGNTLQLGGFAELYPIPNHLRVRAEILQGVTGSRSLVANLGADAIQKTGPFEVSVGPRFQFGDDRYASQYFSVTSFEALVNKNVTPYDASGGLTSIGGLGTVRYDISRQYSLLFFGGYSRLVDGVGESPIVKTIGTPNQFQAGTTLNYTFNFKGFGVFGY